MDKALVKAIEIYSSERKDFIKQCEDCGKEITKRRQQIAANIVTNERLSVEIEGLYSDFLKLKESVAKLSGKIEIVEELDEGI